MADRKLSDVISSVMQKKWTKVNNFSVEFNVTNESFRSLIGWNITEEDFNEALKSIDTPQYTNNPIEQFVGNEWRFNNGRDEMFRFTMTFRDFDQMKMYTSFIEMYNKSKDNYFDKIKCEIKIYLDADTGTKRTQLFSASDCIIESISQIQFDHSTEGQIAEFSVNFKCSSPLHNKIRSNMGVGGSGMLSEFLGDWRSNFSL